MSKYYLELPENSYPQSCKQCWIPCGFAYLGNTKHCPFLLSEDELIKRMLYGIVIPPHRCNAKYTFSMKTKQALIKAMEEAQKVQDIISEVIDKEMERCENEQK